MCECSSCEREEPSCLGTRLVTATVIVVILRGLACMVFTCPLSPSDPLASGLGDLSKG